MSKTRIIITAVIAAGLGLGLTGCGGPTSKFEDGAGSKTYVVGEDIEAGTWRNSVPSGLPKCAWYVESASGAMKASGGTGGDRVANNLRDGDTLVTTGCGTWVLA